MDQGSGPTHDPYHDPYPRSIPLIHTLLSLTIHTIDPYPCSNFPVRMANYIYNDRVNLQGGGKDLGVASVIGKQCDGDAWRVSCRKDEPEKGPLPEALLQRRLQAQRHAKTSLTSRRQPEVERLIAAEGQRRNRAEKGRRERMELKGSDSSTPDREEEERACCTLCIVASPQPRTPSRPITRTLPSSS